MDYKRAFFERIRAARISMGKTPAQMAALLEVPKDTYHRYETRTLLPHHMIQRFCLLAGKEVEWLITGIPRLESLPRGTAHGSADSKTAPDPVARQTG